VTDTANRLPALSQGRTMVSAHALVKHKLALLRDVGTNSFQFRALVRELATLLAYEATSDLALLERDIPTPLAKARGHVLAEQIGLVPILRAGLGMVEAVWELIPDAQVWHIGVYRDEETLEPVHYYNKLPQSPTVDICLVLDPMLATGGSAIAVIDALKDWGVERIRFVGILAAPEGIRALSEAHPDVDIYLAAIDDHLTPPPSGPDDLPEGYIVPGLGDAGDRQFGTQQD
jgi:uracil phosphoribosyltransferase